MHGSGNQVLNSEALNDYGYGNQLEQTNVNSQTAQLLGSMNESNDGEYNDYLNDDEEGGEGRPTGPMLSVFD